MPDLKSFLDTYLTAELIPIAILLPLVMVVLPAARTYLRRKDEGHGASVRTQGIMVTLTLVSLVAIVLALPISQENKHEILNLLAVLGSGALALSSTTLLSNVLAGFMLRSVRNFREGDFLRCSDHFGRVTERGLVHTEIQTEDRDLTTLPNLFLIQNPVTVVRASGTIVSTRVSLGYDAPRGVIESALCDAARAVDLGDPFVHVLQLGDFSVTYRIAGLLTDVRQLVSARSRLNAQAIDHLHRAGIEIVSPTFMSTRAYTPETKVVPVEDPSNPEPSSDSSRVEEIVFDKADVAQSIEELKQTVATLEADRASLNEKLKAASDADEKEKLKTSISSVEKRLERMGKVIDDRKEHLKAHDDESVS